MEPQMNADAACRAAPRRQPTRARPGEACPGGGRRPRASGRSVFGRAAAAVASGRERAPDLVAQRRVVTVMRGPRRRNPSIRVETAEVELVPRLRGQPFEIAKLCAAVALTEGVNVVHIAHDRPGRRRERRAT
jgi:hypothetical protein